MSNYSIPNTRIGDIDGLLLGPKGIIILEIKNFIGKFKISGDDIYRENKDGHYQHYRINPFDQIIKRREYLKKILREEGLDIPILPIVVFVEDKINSISGHPSVFITEAHNLVNNIFELNPISIWNSELLNKILAVLGVNNLIK